MTSVEELGRRAKAASRLARRSVHLGQERGVAHRRRPARRAGRPRSRPPTTPTSTPPADGGMAAGPLDRLRLTDARLAGMADGLRTVADLPDPVGEVLDGWKRPNGLEITRVRVPLGVIAIIYENRPNVTSDAAGLVREGRQRGDPARLVDRAAVERRGRVGAARRARQARLARRRGDPRRRHRVRDGNRGHAAHRLRRLPDPARRPVADPEHSRERDRAGDHRRRRQLPRLRRRRGRSRRGARRSSSTPRPSARACATRPSRCVVHAAVADAFIPRIADALARARRRAGRRRGEPTTLCRTCSRPPTTTSAASSSI